MANFFVVFDQSLNNGGYSPQTFKSAKTLEPAQDANFMKIEAGSVAEAQEAIAAWVPGQNTQKPIVVAEAAWKES